MDSFILAPEPPMKSASENIVVLSGAGQASEIVPSYIDRLLAGGIRRT